MNADFVEDTADKGILRLTTVGTCMNILGKGGWGAGMRGGGGGGARRGRGGGGGCRGGARGGGGCRGNGERRRLRGEEEGCRGKGGCRGLRQVDVFCSALVFMPAL